MSVSHEHSENQTQFNYIVTGGARHIAISNYYPSKPIYPLNSVYTYGIPDDAISCPNAEHHNFSVMDLHLNSLGSFFESGSPRGETPLGVNGASPRAIIPQIIADLQFATGGGITINHPSWSNLTVETIKDILDIDHRVLGIEIFNSFIGPIDLGWEGETVPHIESMTANIEKWDAILKTGRKCWGFCVADHQGQSSSEWMGRNILLVGTATEQKCLEAYRNGAFYGQLKTTNLGFSNISFSNGVYSIKADNADSIKIIIDGIEKTYNNNVVNVSVPSTAIYARAEAYGNDDIIFTNPIIFKEYKAQSDTSNILLYLS